MNWCVCVYTSEFTAIRSVHLPTMSKMEKSSSMEPIRDKTEIKSPVIIMVVFTLIH